MSYNILLKALAACCAAIIFTLMMPQEAQAASCGGENQKSCWPPKKKCNEGLIYKFGNGVPGSGRCIKPEDSSCGGLNQKSCMLPVRACQADLKYKWGGILPGQGRCVKDPKKEAEKAAIANAKTMADKITSTEDNPLADLRSCLMRSENFGKLKSAMSSRDTDATNDLVRGCGASRQNMTSFSEDTSGFPTNSLSIELGAAATAWVTAGAGVGISIPLGENQWPRWYVTGSSGAGPGLAVGADLAVGLSSESVPTTRFAHDKNSSISFGGKVVYGGSISIDFPRTTNWLSNPVSPTGFTLAGGAGGGVEVGVVRKTGALYYSLFIKDD